MMNRSARLYLSVLIATACTLSLLAAPGRGAGPKTSTSRIELASVNGEAITDADLKGAFVSKHGGHTVFLGGDLEVKRFLDVVINERLLIQEGYNLSLDRDPEVQPKVDAFRDKKAAEKLLKAEIEGKSAPTPEEIRAVWSKSNEVVLARELLLDTEVEAQEAYRSLMAGADFETIARACSTSPTKTKGGRLAPFARLMQPAVIETLAFSLEPGAISEPVQTDSGWVILQVFDRVETERPPLDKRTEEMFGNRLRQRKSEELQARLSADLWKKYDARIVAADSAVTLLRLLNTSPDAVVAEWNGGKLPVRDAFAAGELRMFASFAPGQSALKVESTLRNAVNTALVKVEAHARKLDELPDVVEAVDTYERGLIESQLYAKYVLRNVTVEESEVKAEYEKQKANLLMPEKRRVAHIALATADEAKALLDRIRKGEEYEVLLKQHTLDKASIKTAGDLGWIEKGKVSEKYDPLFSVAQGGIADPIQSEVAWHLVRVTDIQPSHPLSYDEAREKLRSNLLEVKKHDAREKWISKLREASTIKVHEAALRKFVKNNPYEAPK